MKVIVKAVLGPPSNKKHYGRNADNRPIFSITHEVEIGREQFGDVLRGRIGVTEGAPFCSIQPHSYNPHENTLLAFGAMLGDDEEYMDTLIKQGWVLDENNARHHNLPVKEKV